MENSHTWVTKETITADKLNGLAELDGVNEIEDRLNTQSLNVKNFGAIGDGIADDTGPIQAALDAVPENGGIVYIPAGTYLVDQQKLRDGSTDTYGALFPKPNTTMLGVGPSTIIQLADGTTKVDLIYAKNTPNLKFIDLTIDAGPRNTPYWTTGLQLDTVDNLVIRDVTVTRGNIEGVYLYNSTNFDIKGLHTHDNGAWQDDASGLHLDSDHNGVVSNIISHNNGFHGVIISSSWEIVINNITAHHNGWQGLHIQTGSNKIQVTNGSFTNNSRGIYIKDWGTDNNLLSNIVVASNAYDGVLTWITYNNIINGMQALNNGEYGVETGVNDDTIYIYASIFKNNTLGDTHEVDNSHIYINGLDEA